MKNVIREIIEWAVAVTGATLVAAAIFLISIILAEVLTR